MSWKREMEEAACKLAIPDQDILPTDTIEVEMDIEEEHQYGTYTFSGGQSDIIVRHIRDGNVRSSIYSKDDAAEFWMNLMRSGD